MKKFLLLILMIVASKAKSQFNELTFGVGTAHYIGDLNTGSDPSSSSPSISDVLSSKNTKSSYSIGFRHGFKSRFSIGINYYNLNLCGYDSDNTAVNSNDPGFANKVRNLNFHTSVDNFYVDLRYEFNRTPKKWLNEKWLWSPYVGLGIGAFQFNPKTFYNGNEIDLKPYNTEGQGLPGYGQPYKLIVMDIPMNFGFKIYNPTRRVSLQIDANYNYTFTDYIDDVSGKYPNPKDIDKYYGTAKELQINALANRNITKGYEYLSAPGKQRGNSANNDHFLTFQMKFSFNFFRLMRR